VTVETLLERLERVQARGMGRWTACCPAHKDRSPSLSICEKADGVVLIHCFGGCDPDDVVGAVGLEVADLFPPSAPEYGKYSYRGRTAAFDAHAALHAVATELNVVAMLAETMPVNGKVRDRLLLAAGRVNRGLDAIGERRN